MGKIDPSDIFFFFFLSTIDCNSFSLIYNGSFLCQTFLNFYFELKFQLFRLTSVVVSLGSTIFKLYSNYFFLDTEPL